MAETPPATGPSPVQQVLLCDQYQRTTRGFRASASSLPGHLIQLTTRGAARHVVGGQGYAIRPGDLIWFHEDETVEVLVEEAPWTFYTVNFVAPALGPPGFEERVRRVGDSVAGAFEALLAAWRNTGAPPLVRQLRVQAAMLGLLGEIASQHGGVVWPSDAEARTWWEIETRLRADLSRPASLRRMVAESGWSVATIARACRSATGLTPMRRIKAIRLSRARGLVRGSTLTLTQIAQRVGYARLHEFSRDYRRHFGHPPSADRA